MRLLACLKVYGAISKQTRPDGGGQTGEAGIAQGQTGDQTPAMKLAASRTRAALSLAMLPSAI